MGLYSRSYPDSVAVRTVPTSREDIVNLRPGTPYYAKRNGPGRVLTFLRHDDQYAWSYNEQHAYPYNWGEMDLLDPAYTAEEVKALIEATTAAYEVWRKASFTPSPTLCR